MGMKSQKRMHANEETRQAWDENAAFWDERMGEGNDFVEVLIWPPTERLIDLKGGERVLDIACGNGLYARKLAKLGAEVVAFDFSEELIALADQRTDENEDRIQYFVLDATDDGALRSLGKQEFDIAVCNMALFDIAEIKSLFNALRELLKPGGRFVFSVIHPCFNNPHMKWVAEQEEMDGKIITSYSVKIHAYLTPTITRGVAIVGQPRPQLYFHRSLQDLLGVGFKAGFILDALQERAFPPDHPVGKNPLSWGGNFSEIPPVLVARMVLRS
jgi:2-polyprenyl-3-methyl-5-hydroxy-6-metoxy-1,4-benzoquinol methylase